MVAGDERADVRDGRAQFEEMQPVVDLGVGADGSRGEVWHYVVLDAPRADHERATQTLTRG